jgi:peptidoglycan/xylan/chitin deacetylase (PgdA/CDA1 family)
VSRFRPLVLCYHAISDGWPHALATSPSTFARQLRALLARGYRPGSAAEAVEGRERIVHVTFDDAFTSVERALPILETLRVPATVFACTGYADDGRPLDVPELADDAARLPHELETMDWDALRSLGERGIDVQSHTVSHPHLPRLGDDELRRELSESRERLESELGRPVRLLAYPFGEEDERVRSAARAAGYDAAFALPGRTRNPDRYALPRVGLYLHDRVLRASLKTTVAGRLAADRRYG